MKYWALTCVSVSACLMWGQTLAAQPSSTTTSLMRAATQAQAAVSGSGLSASAQHWAGRDKRTTDKRKTKKSSKRTSKKHYGFPSQRTATGNRVFIFSPRIHMWAAYDANGRLVKTGRASGGRGYCPDIKRSCRTPRGTFRIISKGSAGCRSSRYPKRRNGRHGGAPMPYCMFFSKYYAIHGSPHVPGYNASHGCIRVPPSAARWLSGNFITRGTTVIVTSY